nr:uncharacterized protein LOC127327190 [Lolium perenne]
MPRAPFLPAAVPRRGRPRPCVRGLAVLLPAAMPRAPFLPAAVPRRGRPRPCVRELSCFFCCTDRLCSAVIGSTGVLTKEVQLTPSEITSRLIANCCRGSPGRGSTRREDGQYDAMRFRGACWCCQFLAPVSSVSNDLRLKFSFRASPDAQLVPQPAWTSSGADPILPKLLPPASARMLQVAAGLLARPSSWRTTCPPRNVHVHRALNF